MSKLARWCEEGCNGTATLYSATCSAARSASQADAVQLLSVVDTVVMVGHRLVTHHHGGVRVGSSG
jgi:hypothetical protein